MTKPSIVIANSNLTKNMTARFIILELHSVAIFAMTAFFFPDWIPNITFFSLAFFGTQALVLLWVLKPALTVRNLRRETLVRRIGLYTLFPLSVILFIVSICSESVLFLAAAAYVILWWTAPLAFFTGDLGKHRISYYESHCSKCLYDISTIEADTCPECNTPITRPEEAST